MNTIFKIIKIIGFSMIECALIFFSHIPLGNMYIFVKDKINPELEFITFYNNIYTLITVIISYIIIGLILFILFKVIEYNFISKHKADSYQYMFLPCILVIIVGGVFDLLFNGSAITELFIVSYIFLPIVTVITILNLIYEFKIESKKKLSQF